MKKIAAILSILFHPFAITPSVFLILSINKRLFSENLFSLIISIIFSTLLPLITFIFLKKIKMISDYNISKRKERIKPLLISSLYFSLGYLSLSIINSEMIIQGLMFCYSLNTILVSIITKFWKISLHAISIAGSLTTLWLDGIQYPFIMITLITIVCSSRLILKAHTLSQVVAGTFFAMSLTYFELYFLFLK